jgi:hypothetical protein
MGSIAAITGMELLPARKQHAPRKLNYSKCSFCRDSKVKAKVRMPCSSGHVLSRAETTSASQVREHGPEKNAKIVQREGLHALRRSQLERRRRHDSSQMLEFTGPLG